MTERIKDLITRLQEEHSLSEAEYAELITGRDKEAAALLARLAEKTRKAVFGDAVYTRGLIEISSICKNNCLYCGIRRSNPQAERYRLTEEEILSCADEGYTLGFRTFVLQGGEDPFFTDEVLCGIVRELKKRHPDCAVTLSMGERSRESYRALHEAGADILLIETQPSLHEALLAAGIAEELGADYWISFSCMDEKHICEGDLIRKCAEAFAKDHPRLQMIGVNCTKPVFIAGLIKELRAGLNTTEEGKKIPIGVYPNSGEEYDPVAKTWHGVGDSRKFGEYALDYMRAGADAAGGCCTTAASHVEQVVAARNAFLAGGAARAMNRQ